MKEGFKKLIDVLMGKEVCCIYDIFNKGILWGWEVLGYVWIKVIFVGVFLVLFLVIIFGWVELMVVIEWWIYGLGFLFFIFIGVLLVMDFD